MVSGDSMQNQEMAGPLPDPNEPRYPHEVVQSLLDEAASFSLLAVPEAPPQPVTLTPDDPEDYYGINGGYGLVIQCSLGELGTSIDTSPFSDPDRTLRVRHRAHAASGSFASRWMMAPEDFQWAVGEEPSPRLFDPWRSQPFVMAGCQLELGGDGDGFEGYGMGRTFPVMVQGSPHLLASAVGTLTQGRGRFEGLDATFSLLGRIVPGLGFQGSVTVRVPDPEGRLRTAARIAPQPEIDFPADEASYLVLRGQKAHRGVRTEYGPPPGPGWVALETPIQMRAVSFPLSTGGADGLRAGIEVGPVVAGLEDSRALDIRIRRQGPMSPPTPFTTRSTYQFATADGYELGTIQAQVAFGCEWTLAFPSAPGQGAVRSGGFGELLGGTGVFAGVQGSVSLNSALTLRPYHVSMIHVLRIVDPEGRFRL